LILGNYTSRTNLTTVRAKLLPLVQWEILFLNFLKNFILEGWMKNMKNHFISLRIFSINISMIVMKSKILHSHEKGIIIKNVRMKENSDAWWKKFDILIFKSCTDNKSGILLLLFVLLYERMLLIQIGKREIG